MLLGAHVSIAGSIDLAPDRAVELGCTTFQIFTRNPRGWRYKKLGEKETAKFREKSERAGFALVMSHMPYLPNLASPAKLVHSKSVRALTEELKRCETLRIKYVVSHVGSHMGAGIAFGIKRVAEACNASLNQTDKVVLLLENMAGQRNSCGSLFEDLSRTLDKMEFPDRVGVCLDTCHLFAAGYDIRNAEAVERTLENFDNLVGIRRLHAIHLNDSRGDLRSGLDRHEHIGMGHIGERGFEALINHPAIRLKPMIIETPVDERGDYTMDLRKLRKLYVE